MIERVEVVRGGGSALFGSSAIAGTVNIITKEPLRNSGSFAHSISNFDGSGSFDNNTTLNLSLVSSDNKWELTSTGRTATVRNGIPTVTVFRITQIEEPDSRRERLL